jgi:ribosomal protein S12 methylthiotransferase accessory factor YcaO
MEALERFSQERSEAISSAAFLIAVLSLSKKHPGLKRESARVIANTAHLYQKNLDEAIVNLLHNAEHRGTVVRWSSATALNTIVQLDIPEKGELAHALKALSKTEEKDSIKKIYSKGLKVLNEEG